MAAREAEAMPFPKAKTHEFAFRVQALKRLEKFVDIGHIEAGAVVAHEIHRPTILLARAEGDLRVAGFTCELPVIAQQILQGDAYEPRIDSCSDVLGGVDTYFAVGVGGGQLRGNA